MRQKYLVCGKQLKHLMEMHDPKLKNAAALSTAMYEVGIFEYSDKPGVTKEESIRHGERAIKRHLNNGKVDLGYMTAYCDFFHCSADYLLGYISSPTHVATDIVKETGLWEENLTKLKIIDSLFFNALISSDQYHILINDFCDLITDMNVYNFSKSEASKTHVKQEKSDLILAYTFANSKFFHDLNCINTDFGNFIKEFENPETVTTRFKRLCYDLSAIIVNNNIYNN